MIGLRYTKKGIMHAFVVPLVAVLVVAGLVVAQKRHGYREPTFVPKNGGADIKLSHAVGKENLVSLLIIGSGPAGLTAALYGRRAGLSTVIIEGNEPGGLLTKTTEVENWPGDRSILGPDLIKRMHAQVKDLGVAFVADLVERIDTSTWPYRVTTANKQVFHAMSIVIATGAQPRLLHIPGEDDYWGRGVSACALCDAGFFVDKDVVVVGGGDSAVEEAFQLAVYARSVTVLVRKEAMRAAMSSQARLRSGSKISVRYAVEPREIVGDGKKVTGIVLYDIKTGKQITMRADGVFLAIGHTPNSAFLEGVVALDSAGYIVTQGRSQASSVTGIFAAGEVEDGDYKQAIVSAGRGACAAIDASRFLTEMGYMPGESQNLLFFNAEGEKSDFEVNEITLEALNSMRSSTSLPILLDFYTDECPSCLALMPAVAELAQSLQGRLQVFKVHAQKQPELFGAYGTPSLPGFALLNPDGSHVVGKNIHTKQQLAAFMQQNFL